jgi:excisionase family DNA binding protein
MLAFPTMNLAKTMPSSPAENAIMTIGEVADYLKVTERTIYRLAGAKQIPAFKVGGSWRFSRADIDGWIRDQSSIESETARQKQ